MDVSWPVKNLSHKKLIGIPLILAAFFGAMVAINWNTEGSPVPLGLDFQGGSFIRVENIQTPNNIQVNQFQSDFLERSSVSDADVRSVESGLQIETSEAYLDNQAVADFKNWISEELSEIGVSGNPVVNIDAMGSAITDIYQSQARNAAIAAVIVMAIILFISLRRYTVVGSILLVIGMDFLGILGGMSLLGIELTRASMAGILLIFGYAVNTNILLSTNIIKRKGGTDRDRAGRAMSTGMKMSSTSAAAMIILNLATTAPELNQISAVIAIGILIDMVNTWLLNSGLIIRHQESEEDKYHARI